MMTKNLLRFRTICFSFTNSNMQDGETALEQASMKGHQKVVESLLGAGANPDLQDKVRKDRKVVYLQIVVLMLLHFHLWKLKP